VVKAKELCDISINKEDVIKIVEFLKKKIHYDAEYFFYSETELDNLFESIIGKFGEFVDEYKLI
jgi:hypothetical protein